jgi:hypothetical protein
VTLENEHIAHSGRPAPWELIALTVDQPVGVSVGADDGAAHVQRRGDPAARTPHRSFVGAREQPNRDGAARIDVADAGEAAVGRMHAHDRAALGGAIEILDRA